MQYETLHEIHILLVEWPRIEQSSLGLAVRFHAKAQCWNLIGIDLATLI